uniref:COG4315 family predicted lipoprotein n=1 Tax=Nocardiopsis lucentensis TaxID=53441 RepID=UPI000369C7BB
MNTEAKGAKALGLALFLLVTACSTDDLAPPPAGSGPGDESSEAAADPGGSDTGATDGGGGVAALGTVWDERFGDVLTDGEGNVLYRFADDEANRSTCVDGCAENWPPLHVTDEGAPVSADGAATADLVDTIERDDGSLQLTYAEWPLYTYAGDAAPGDVNGQGVGGAWYVVDPSGRMVTGAQDGADGSADT